MKQEVSAKGTIHVSTESGGHLTSIAGLEAPDAKEKRTQEKMQLNKKHRNENPMCRIL